MTRIRILILLVALFFLAAIGLSVLQAQTPPARAPIASNPIVSIEGKIVAAKLVRGYGMPTINVDIGKAAPVTVWLGSMRYLMEQKFNPKAGEAVEVKGYSVKNDQEEEEIVAISVKLPASNQVLKLRDENGFPVWAPGGGRGPCAYGPRGAAFRGGGCPNCGGPAVGCSGCPHCGR